MHDVEQVTYEQTKRVLGGTASVVFYDNKRKSVLLHTQEEPEETELFGIISANC